MIGCGAYLPQTILTNDELAKRVDTSDEWIVERTGIHSRRIAMDGEKTSDLALNAAREALADAGIGADVLDMVVVATTTPDETFPAVATAVQAAARHDAGCGLRCSGGMFWLHLRTRRRRQLYQSGTG